MRYRIKQRTGEGGVIRYIAEYKGWFFWYSCITEIFSWADGPQPVSRATYNEAWEDCARHRANRGVSIAWEGDL